MTENERVQNIIKANTWANLEIQPAKSQRKPAPALVKAIPRAQKVHERIILCYTICRVRPLDTDNAYGSTKNCTDILRRCGLIPGDDPTRIELKVIQKRVSKYSQEQTEIEIVYPL